MFLRERAFFARIVCENDAGRNCYSERNDERRELASFRIYTVAAVAEELENKDGMRRKL